MMPLQATSETGHCPWRACVWKRWLASSLHRQTIRSFVLRYAKHMAAANNLPFGQQILLLLRCHTHITTLSYEILLQLSSTFSQHCHSPVRLLFLCGQVVVLRKRIHRYCPTCPHWAITMLLHLFLPMGSMSESTVGLGTQRLDADMLGRLTFFNANRSCVCFATLVRSRWQVAAGSSPSVPKLMLWLNRHTI